MTEYRLPSLPRTRYVYGSRGGDDLVYQLYEHCGRGMFRAVGDSSEELVEWHELLAQWDKVTEHHPAIPIAYRGPWRIIQDSGYTMIVDGTGCQVPLEGPVIMGFIAQAVNRYVAEIQLADMTRFGVAHIDSETSDERA